MPYFAQNPVMRLQDFKLMQALNRLYLVDGWKWVLLVFCLTYYPLWHNLSAPSIYIWDEASYALNALEMSQDKDFLVPKTNGLPSLYNVKPPLVIWFQCASIWCFGPGEWAIRFPSALAGLLTCLFVFFFAKRHFGACVGLFAVLFLVTTEGYVRHHVTRTGDLDSLLVFFITAYALLFMDLMLAGLSADNLKKRLNWIGFLVLGAFMTKSISGLMPLCGLALGAIAVGKGRLVFANPRVYFTAIWVALGCLLYYAIRGYAQEGYLEKVWFSEYMRFTENIMPWLEAPWYYYFVTLKSKLYPTYTWALPFAYLLLRSQHEKVKKLAYLGMIYCATLVLLYSYPAVKLDWYIAPIYPILSLMLACLLQSTVAIIKTQLKIEKRKMMLYSTALVLVFSIPYYHAIKRTENVDILEPQERAGHDIRELSIKHPSIKDYKLFMPVEHLEHCDAALFYIKKMRQEGTRQIEMVLDVQQIQTGDTVLCSQRDGRKMLKERFELDTLISLQHGFVFRLKEKRDQ